MLAEAWAQAGARRHDPLRVRVERRPAQRVAARVTAVPGFGWAPFCPAPLGQNAVAGGTSWLQNGLVRVDVDTENGTFSLNGLAGLDRLVDGGDEGDTYNYSPPAVDTIVEQPDLVTVELIETGPVRAGLRIRRRFSWPAGVRNGHRVGRQPVEVVTELELHAGEEFVRVRRPVSTIPAATTGSGPGSRCRTRPTTPLPSALSRPCPARRPEGGPHEPALGTYPARRFVMAGGLTLTHEGLLEYELVDGGRALALTLLRSTGVLSRPAPTARPNSAGPPDPLQAPLMLGPQRARYAVAVGPRQPVAAGRRGLAAAAGPARQRHRTPGRFRKPADRAGRRGFGPAPRW